MMRKLRIKLKKKEKGLLWKKTGNLKLRGKKEEMPNELAQLQNRNAVDHRNKFASLNSILEFGEMWEDVWNLET